MKTDPYENLEFKGSKYPIGIKLINKNKKGFHIFNNQNPKLKKSKHFQKVLIKSGLFLRIKS